MVIMLISLIWLWDRSMVLRWLYYSTILGREVSPFLLACNSMKANPCLSKVLPTFTKLCFTVLVSWSSRELYWTPFC